MTPETILNAAMGVLRRRGRAFADYGDSGSGPVCVLAAIAISSGLSPEMWRYLDEAFESEWEPSEVLAVAAARRLLASVAPWMDPADTFVPDLIAVIADWYDRATDNELYGALLLAALSVPAEQIEALA